MNLFGETGAFAKWYSAVLGTFVRTRPLTMISLVLCSAVGKLTHILARLLPIKVILLAAGHGVPSYFQPFLSPDQKTLGLVVLTAAALFCYVADYALEGLAQKLAEAGSRKVVENANDVVLTNHRRKAQGTYVSVAEMTADLLFASGFFFVILFINASLFGLLAAFFAAAFTGTAWILRGNVYEHGRRSAVFIRDELDAYLNILSILAFIVAFVFIIHPFLTGGNANVLLAILAIAFLRRVLRAVTSAVSTAAGLYERTVEVNALIFRDHQVQRRERPESRALRELFEGRRRQKLLERELARFNGGVDALQTQWLDPAGGTQRFRVDASFNSGEKGVFVGRIFPPSRIPSLDSEEILFRYVPRRALLAPPVAARFTAAPFECQISDLGGGAEPAAAPGWRQTHAEIVETLWSLAPPEALVTAHRSSHADLHERLTYELIERTSIAISSNEEGTLFQDLLDCLPCIQEDLKEMPLFISNPNLGADAVWQREGGELFLLDWGHWSIQPFGAGQLPLRGDPSAINAIIERVRARRAGVPPRLGAAQVLLAANCADLERAIERGSYRSALEIAKLLVSGRRFEYRAQHVADELEDKVQQEVA